jgi:mono/diheme cytochrome c family protein
MREQLLRRLAATLTVCAVVGACGGGARSTDPVPYLDDAAFRRAELVTSLWSPDNQYSQLRLAHYATGDSNDWDLLPEWNPAVDVIAASELDAPGGASSTAMSASATPLALPENVTSEDDPALVALGEAAFRRYPVELNGYFRVALASRAAAAQYGLWVDETRGVGGLVRAQMAAGSGAIGVTCSTCHEALLAGTLTPGLPNASLDPGKAMLAGSTVPNPTVAEAIAAWGPGRLDVTTTVGKEPVRIADLRPVRWLTYLQADATVSMRDRTALAIRLETLIITSHGEALRPPRMVTLALAAYVASLADALPAADAAAQASPGGAQLFASQCASCHVPAALTGPPVPLGVVGTDPALGESLVRGTGDYRVPSLHGVGTRGPLLHDGTVPSLDAMFDPARVTPGFSGKLHGTGAVEGHPFGLDLQAADRAALVAYVKAL